MTPQPQANPRRVAFDVLMRVAEGAYSDMALDAALKRSTLDQRDRRLVTELVYGVLRLRGRLDFVIEQFSDRPLSRIQTDLSWLLRLGAYQLLELERIPAHAAVDSSVTIARQLNHVKATGFINAILRSLERGRSQIPWPKPDEIKPYLQHCCGLPTWLAKEIMRLLPNSEARALAESMMRVPPLTLRVNHLKIIREDYLQRLETDGHEGRAGAYAEEAIIVEKRGENPLPGDRDGLYQVQDEASMLMGHLLDVAPGQKILDACAAPGGKTTHIAALTENGAEIVALEKHPQRVEMIRQGSKRLGCSGISAHQWDLTVIPDFLEPHSFDRVLVDAPCSGLGVLRRNPEGRWNKSKANLKSLAELQRTILGNVAGLVRPGGKLLYSVCTFSELETNAVVSDFLEGHPEFSLDPLNGIMPAAQSELVTDTGTFRSYPHRHGGMDAFFAARFIRNPG